MGNKEYKILFDGAMKEPHFYYTGTFVGNLPLDYCISTVSESDCTCGHNETWHQPKCQHCECACFQSAYVPA